MRTSPVLKGFNCLEAALAATPRAPNEVDGEWKVEVGETDKLRPFWKALVKPPAMSRAEDMLLLLLLLLLPLLLA
jgi:hypothetical protein